MAVSIAGSDTGMSLWNFDRGVFKPTWLSGLPHPSTGIDADRAADLHAGAGAFNRDEAGAVFGAGCGLAARDRFRRRAGGRLLRCRFAVRLSGKGVCVRQQYRKSCE